MVAFDLETETNFTPLINEVFIYAIVYSFIWVGLIAFWKSKYSEIKDFINDGK